MEIFTKLLEINMVASNFFGFSTRRAMMLPTADFPSLRLFTSVGESEKRATSDPEIKAEQPKSIRKTTNCKIIFQSSILSCNAIVSTAIDGIQSKLRGGSESKSLVLVKQYF